MNTIVTNLAGTALLAAGLCLFPTCASAQEVILGINLDGKKVLVQLDGKNVKATIDGDELPESQIETKGNLIIVKDSEGDPVANIQRWANGANVYRIKRSNKAAIGIELNTLSKGLADHLELDPGEVIYVTRVFEGRAAAKAGLRDHDVIVEIDGESPVNEKKLFSVLEKKKPGDTLAVRVLRRGKEQDFSIRCERAKSPSNQLWGTTMMNTPFLTQWRSGDEGYKASLKSANEVLERLNKVKLEKLSEKDYKAQLEKLQEALIKAQGKTGFNYTVPNLYFDKGDFEKFDGSDFPGYFRMAPKVFDFGKGEKGKKGKKGITFVDPKRTVYGMLDDSGNVISKKPKGLWQSKDFTTKTEVDTSGLNKKLEKLEKQFDRLEKMLQSLVEKKNNN